MLFIAPPHKQAAFQSSVIRHVLQTRRLPRRITFIIKEQVSNAARNDGSAARNDGSAARNDGCASQ